MPDVIFTDLASLPWDARAYWASWTTPHVFFIPTGDSEVDDWGFRAPSWPPPVPPLGWMAWGQTFSPCEAGEATLGWWEVVVWYPPAYPAAAPAPLSPWPWFPLRAFIKDQVAARPVPVCEAPVDLPAVATVVRLEEIHSLPGAKPGGCVQQWGLLPDSDLSASVLLAALGSPSGWGTQALLPLELAALWDVP